MKKLPCLYLKHIEQAHEAQRMTFAPEHVYKTIISLY